MSADDGEWELGYLGFLMHLWLSVDWLVAILMSNLALLR